MHWNLPLFAEKVTLFEEVNARSDLTDTDIQTARFMRERGNRPTWLHIFQTIRLACNW